MFCSTALTKVEDVSGCVGRYSVFYVFSEFMCQKVVSYAFAMRGAGFRYVFQSVKF